MTFDELNHRYERILGERGMYFECHDGWAGILDAYFAVVDHHLPPGESYDCRQVKEKFGGLRIYDSADVSDEVREIINEARELAEARAFYVCEMCGQPGVLRGKGWYRVRCDEHARDPKTGEIEAPSDPAPDVRIGSPTSGEWHRYDPELDLFTSCKPPEDF